MLKMVDAQARKACEAITQARAKNRKNHVNVYLHEDDLKKAGASQALINAYRAVKAEEARFEKLHEEHCKRIKPLNDRKQKLIDAHNEAEHKESRAAFHQREELRQQLESLKMQIELDIMGADTADSEWLTKLEAFVKKAVKSLS
jgi:hypothetical protein